MDAAGSSPQNGLYSPTATFGQFRQTSGGSTTSSPSLTVRSTFEGGLQSPGIYDPGARLRHQKSVPSIDGGGIMSLDSVRQVQDLMNRVDEELRQIHWRRWTDANCQYQRMFLRKTNPPQSPQEIQYPRRLE